MANQPDVNSEYQWVYDLLLEAFGPEAVKVDTWNAGKNLSYTVWKSPKAGPDNPYCWLMQMLPDNAEVEVEHNGYIIKGKKSMNALAALSTIDAYAQQLFPHVIEYRFNDQPDKLKEAVEEVEKIRKWFEQ